MSMTRRVALAAALATLFSAGAADARQFKSSDVQGADQPVVKAVAYMGELMRQRSGGRLGIADLGASDNDSEIFTVAQVRTGTQDMARVSMFALHSSVPASVIPTVPFLFTSTAHRRRVLDGPIGEELLTALAEQDLVGLCFYDAGARSIYTAGRPVRTPADMKGLRIRVQAAPTMVEVVKALGAVPVPSPYGQIRSLFAAGTIDAAENNLVSYYGARHFEVAKVYSVTEHAAPPAVVFFTTPIGERPPAADRHITHQPPHDSVPYFHKLVDEQEAAARAALAAQGVQFVSDIDRAAFVRLLTPLYPKLVPDPRHRALVERIQAVE